MFPRVAEYPINQSNCPILARVHAHSRPIEFNEVIIKANRTNSEQAVRACSARDTANSEGLREYFLTGVHNEASLADLRAVNEYRAFEAVGPMPGYIVPEPGTPAGAAPFGTFLNPTAGLIRFLLALLPPAPDKAAFVDIGAGKGYLSACLNEAARPGTGFLPLETLPHDDAVFPTFPLDATTFTYTAGFIPILARPCHGWFPRNAILRAVKGVGFCIYVGLERNVGSDLDFVLKSGLSLRSVAFLSGAAGLDGEGVWIVGDADRKEYKNVLALTENAEQTAKQEAAAQSEPEPEPLHSLVNPFNKQFDRVVLVKSRDDKPVQHGGRGGPGLLVGLKQDSQRQEMMYWECGRSYCPWEPDLWRIVHEFRRLDGESGRDAMDRVWDENDALLCPDPTEPVARLGVVSPDGLFFACSYCAHKELCRLLALKYPNPARMGYSSGREALKKAGWILLQGGGYFVTSDEHRWTEAQKATAQKLVDAFAEAEANGVDLDKTLLENREGLSMEAGWSNPWADDALQSMRNCLKYLTGDAPAGDAPPRSELDTGVTYNRRYRADGTPDGD